MLRMKKYKYFHILDQEEEAIGIVKAKNEKQAYVKASKKKQLPIADFINIFGVKEIEE
tara:strand:+ start:2033 stop:2206 length:174 start_codon:yes stop_codon:yes gene_type:complete